MTDRNFVICGNCNARVKADIRFCPKCGNKLGGQISNEDLSNNPYEVLQVGTHASIDVITVAYKALAKKYHPDSPSGDKEKMQNLNWAYSILSDERKRAEWDRVGNTKSASGKSHASRPYPSKTGTTKKTGNTKTTSGTRKGSTPSTYQTNGSDSKGFFWLVGGIVLVTLFLFFRPPSQSSIPTPNSVIPTSTRFISATSTITPPIIYNGYQCLFWKQVNARHIGMNLCLYGKIYNLGPDLDNWNTIYFDSSQASLRVIDFNFTYGTGAESIGKCAVVYGKIRDDIGPYLVITPAIDAADHGEFREMSVSCLQ